MAKQSWCPAGAGLLAAFFWVLGAAAGPSFAQSGACGEVIEIETRPGTTTRYAMARPAADAPAAEPVALVLLPGGGGNINLDDNGCARRLAGNSLVRSVPLFRGLGFSTALVDAPSDRTRGDGLGGFRIASRHAEDLGKIIADVRTRTQAAVWLVGTSRGSISAVNAASRLSGSAAPDGIVLTSALMEGDSFARKAWVAHSVFDLPLEDIRVPVLVVGHAEDQCIRSPARLMDRITERTNGAREQVVTVTGGPGSSFLGPSVDACQGRMPHGFVDQEREVASGMARFIRGGRY